MTKLIQLKQLKQLKLHSLLHYHTSALPQRYPIEEQLKIN
jgi:hypothetical protein